MPDTTRTAGEQEFINQKTRELMVTWCDNMVVFGTLLNLGMSDRHDPTAPMPHRVYFEFAKEKKWISADGTKILAAGWDTAARYLKR